MGSRPSYISTGSRIFILLIVIVVLAVVGNESWLTTVVSLAPLAFLSQESRPEGTASELEDFRDRLHTIQADAWRRRRPGRRVAPNDWWGIADVPKPLVERGIAVPPGRPSRLRQQIQSLLRRPENGSSPQTQEPSTHEALDPEDVPKILDVIAKNENNLVLLGPEGSGKTGTLLGFMLAAQHERTQDPAFPLAVRVTLAGWADRLASDEVFAADPSLLAWVRIRFREDYPGLLEHGAPADALLNALFREDSRAGGNTLILFVDDIDQVPPDHQDDLLHELSGRTVVMTYPTPTTRAAVADWPGRWEAVNLAVPSDADIRELLKIRDSSLVPESMRQSPRLLRTLRSAYPDDQDLAGWLGEQRKAPAATGNAAIHALWSDLITRGWPSASRIPTGAPGPSRLRRATTGLGRAISPVTGRLRLISPSPPPGATRTPASWDDSPAGRTLIWVTQAGLFRNTRFAWWEVPRLAADPGVGTSLVTVAYRRVRWRRAVSAMLWAAGTFAVCLTAIAALLFAGLIQGFDRASHGLQGSGPLTPADIRQWSWSAPEAMVSNPVYLSGWVLLVVVLTVYGLARYGDEFEHREGGRPQIIRPRLPSLRGLREIVALVPPATRQLLAVVLALALALQVSASGLSAQLWVGLAFSGLFVALLAWLHWCSQEGDNLTPTDTFASDLRSARVVSITLGLATLATSTTLSWWFTSPGHVPTIGQSLWISAAAATSIGMARGFFLGAGMIAPILFPLRTGFGIGYAKRMQLLEDSLRRVDRRGTGSLSEPPEPREPAPLAVISAFDLDEMASWEEERERGLVLRHVGSLIRLRDITLEHFLLGPAGYPAAPVREPAGLGWRRPIVYVSLTMAVLSLTGAAAVVVPRLLCMSASNPFPLGEQAPAAQTWLENGQCVGFETLRGGHHQFSAATEPSGEPEATRDDILARIERQNAAIPDSGHAMNILFMAPISRTAGSSGINALYQLKGAQEAQAAINRDGEAYVRLTVANVGEDFTSGPSVVQTIEQRFSSDPRDRNAVRAVIGIAQSRAAAREALAPFRDIPIVAGSINGNDMRHGLVSDLDVDLGADFVSVAPSNDQVAAAMLSDAALEQADATINRIRPTPPGIDHLKIIADRSDTYFSNDLANALSQLGPGSAPPSYNRQDLPVHDLRETASDQRYEDLAEEMCARENARDVWLFAGRGNQLTRLNGWLDQVGSPDCRPVIIAGPGALSTIQADTEAGTSHLGNLLFYSLINERPRQSDRSASWSAAVAQGGDLATGWAALVEAYRRVLPAADTAEVVDVDKCPRNPETVPQIGISIPAGAEGDGHNTLSGPRTGCGLVNGSRIYLCPVTPMAPGRSCLNTKRFS